MQNKQVFPTFAMLRMARCQAESSVTGPSRKLTLKCEQDVKLDLQEISESAPLHAQVMISFDALAFEGDEAKPELKASVEYVAEFRYPAEAHADDVRSLFVSYAHQRELVMQAFPVAVAQFRSLLASMGLAGALLPLTPP